MYANSDDIVALATVAGKSALNVVRLSGVGSRKKFQQITRIKTNPKPNHVYPKYIYSGVETDPFDFASLVYYKSPKSFTGEDSLEVFVHGGVIIANKLIETLISLGARQALPGEFSYRAFSNNKIDLLQAEGISSIVQANNSIDSYYLLNNIKGVLSSAVKEIRQEVIDLITQGEHEIDFTEQEMTQEEHAVFSKGLLLCQKKIEKVLKTSYVETQESSAVRVAIVGFPNVGKSSIFNHILGQSRSIVTDERGTTRDVVEKEVYIGTTLVTLIDTAGLRDTKNKAEVLGINKTYEEITNANILLIVDDVNPQKIYKKIQSNIKSQKFLLVHNKIDLIKRVKKTVSVYNLSCKNTEGFNSLLTELLTLCKKEIDFFNSQYLYLLNKRQKDLLKKIKLGFVLVNKEYSQTQDLSACLSGLYIVRDHFNILIQPENKENILNSIFKGFCVGK
jgi:tRNA modification GTPase